MKRVRVPAVIAALAIVGGATAIVAQAPAAGGADAALAFDVASVKRTQPGTPRIVAMAMGAGQFAIRPGGRLAAPSVTVRDMVRVAYGVEAIQVVGGPDWAAADRFDIDATTRPDVTTDAARGMLRRLLQERFNLAARLDTRELSVMTLTPSRDDSRLGPQLRRSGMECAPASPPPFLPLAPPPPPPPPGAGRPLLLGPSLRCPGMVLTGHMSLREITMAQFASRLIPLVSRLVVDRTDLAGPFDLDLTYAPDPGTEPLRVNGAAITIDAPALPAALRAQLGLKIDASKAPVEVVVIDRVEAPTEN